MKIGIDGRIFRESSWYALYCEELSYTLAKIDKENEYHIYTHDILHIERRSFLGNMSTKKVFEKEQFDLMVFFDHHIPYNFSGRYIVVLDSLREHLYQEKGWIQKKIESFLLSKMKKNCERYVCLPGITDQELNEKLNITDEYISKIPAFFSHYSIKNDYSELSKLDIKAKHNLEGEYFIYDDGDELYSCLEKVLKAFANLKKSGRKLYLLVLCEETSKDVDIRSKVLEYDIVSSVIFVGSIEKELEYAYYSQSRGVIGTSIYEVFPFAFTKAMSYKKPLIVSDIALYQDILGSYAHYLDTRSASNIAQVLESASDSKEIKTYLDLFSEYTRENSAKALQEIIYKQI